MPEKKLPLHLNLIELMKQKAGGVSSSFEAEKGVIELGELLRKSYLHPSDRIVTARLVGEIVEQLSGTGDQRNAKAYLTSLVEEFTGPPELKEERLGRTA